MAVGGRTTPLENIASISLALYPNSRRISGPCSPMCGACCCGACSAAGGRPGMLAAGARPNPSCSIQLTFLHVRMIEVIGVTVHALAEHVLGLRDGDPLLGRRDRHGHVQRLDDPGCVPDAVVVALQVGIVGDVLAADHLEQQREMMRRHGRGRWRGGQPDHVAVFCYRSPAAILLGKTLDNAFGRSPGRSSAGTAAAAASVARRVRCLA